MSQNCMSSSGSARRGPSGLKVSFSRLPTWPPASCSAHANAQPQKSICRQSDSLPQPSSVNLSGSKISRSRLGRAHKFLNTARLCIITEGEMFHHKALTTLNLPRLSWYRRTVFIFNQERSRRRRRDLTCAPTFIYGCKCVCIYIYMCIYMCVYTSVYTHIHTCM